MKNNEVRKALEKIEVVLDFFDECSDREYSISNMKAQELIEKLEEIK